MTGESTGTEREEPTGAKGETETGTERETPTAEKGGPYDREKGLPKRGKWDSSTGSP